MYSCALSAYVLAYSIVLTIVHLDSTSILSLYNSICLIKEIVNKVSSKVI
jgi:hypothetical protein